MTGNRLLFIACFVLLSAGLAGCAQTPVDDGETTTTTQETTSEETTDMSPIKIGALMPLTGVAQSLGVPAHQGVILAVEEINDGGGIGGRDVELLSGDTKFPETQTAIAELERLVGDGVEFIVGALASDSTDAVQTKATDAGVVLMSPSSTRPSLTGADHGTFYRVIANDTVQGPQSAAIIFEDLAVDSTAVMFQQTGYAEGLKDVFVPAYEEMGGTVVGEPIAWTDDETQHDNRAQEAVALQTDFIWIAGQAPEIASLIKALGAQGFEGTIMTSEAIESDEIFDIACDDVSGVLFTKSSPDLQSNAYQTFVAAYTARWGSDPGPFDAFAYDAVYVGAAAIEGAGNDGGAIASWLDNNGVEGRVTTPTISFNANGDVTTGGYSLWQITCAAGEGAYAPHTA